MEFPDVGFWRGWLGARKRHGWLGGEEVLVQKL
jgi:hypothetical protein